MSILHTVHIIIPLLRIRKLGLFFIVVNSEYPTLSSMITNWCRSLAIQYFSAQMSLRILTCGHSKNLTEL